MIRSSFIARQPSRSRSVIFRKNWTNFTLKIFPIPGNLRRKIEESGMNDEARKEAEKVLNRMKQEGKDSHEYGLLYDYLDFMTSLDWKAPQFTPIDLDRAEQILDEDHYGLKKVKERIIQQLAVMALNRKQYGSILLFVGAPGTGKTSIGQSIARALGREYVRISLGGIRDEAEIRGHRRTYIGAMPGRIMEGIKRSGVSNPVIVLDEVDKLAKITAETLPVPFWRFLILNRTALSLTTI